MRELVDHFVEWCRRNHLLLNVNKTKEMAVDFRRKRTAFKLIHVTGEVGTVTCGEVYGW